MTEKEISNKVTALSNAIFYELQKIYEVPDYLTLLQDEILIKLVALRCALLSPDFKEGTDKRVLDNIYDRMYDLSNEFVKNIKREKDESDNS